MAVSDSLRRIVDGVFYTFHHFSQMPTSVLVFNSPDSGPLLVRQKSIYGYDLPRNVLLIFDNDRINVGNSVSSLYKYINRTSIGLISVFYKQNVYHVGNGNIFDANFNPLLLAEFNDEDNQVNKILIDKSVWETNSDPVKASIKKTAFPYFAGKVRIEVTDLRNLVTRNIDSEFSTEVASKFILDNFDDFIEDSICLNALVYGERDTLGLYYRY